MRPSTSAATSLQVIFWTTSNAFGPRTRISPMCETSKRPAFVRTAHVLVDEAGVLDGHLPAAERDQLAVESLVRFEQRCALEGGGF